MKDDRNTKNAVFRVFHYPHRKEDKGLILLPIQVDEWRRLRNMRKGDYIQFEGSTENKEVLGLAKLNLKTAVAEFLCRYIYGVPLSMVQERWYNNVVAFGASKSSIDKDYCLIIYYKKSNQDE